MKPHLALVTPPATASADPAQRLVIVGCSAEKTPTTQPLPALDLYDGGCVPPLRARLGHRPELRARVRFLSARHGLVTADTPLNTYDRPLDPARAANLRPQVWMDLMAETAHNDAAVVRPRTLTAARARAAPSTPSRR